jgi:Mce-associated membrane protein
MISGSFRRSIRSNTAVSKNDDMLLRSGEDSPVASRGPDRWSSRIGLSRGKRLNTAFYTNRCDDPSLAEAMQEVARAEARAETARVRAIRLSRDAESASSGQLDTNEAADAARVDHTAVDDNVRVAHHGAARSVRIVAMLRRPDRKALAVGAALLLVCAFLAVSGYVVQYHHRAADERHRAEEFAAAARQAVTALMSIDASKARDGVQRIIDDSTGPFKTGVLLGEDDLVKAVEDSRVSTKVAVKAVAVESMTDDWAVVLVATRAEVAHPDKSKPPPRSWRVVITIQRDGGKLKIAKAESLP